MSYIGTQPTSSNFSFDQFSGNGSTKIFTLSYAPASVTSIIVTVAGVIQNPSTYSLSSTTLTFVTAPAAGTNNIGVLYLGLPVQVGVPTPGSTAQFALGSAANPSITFLGDTNTGIYSPGADTLAFTEGGTEVMRIDSSRNVGVGTTTPSEKLHISSSTPTLLTESTASATNGSAYNVLKSNTGPGSLYYRAILGQKADGTFDWGIGNFGSDAQSLVFYSGGITERARIDSSGNLMVGGTSYTDKINSVHNSNSNWAISANLTAPTGAVYGYIARIASQSPNNTGSYFTYYTDSTTLRCAIYSNGGIANYQANNSNLSDRREKTNFAPAGNYLSKICAIPVQTFNYVDQNLEEDDGLTLGVVAQDVQEVAPELVTEINLGAQDDPKMRLSIYQTDLQYALMKCIQELKAELDVCKAEIAALKGV